MTKRSERIKSVSLKAAQPGTRQSHGSDKAQFHGRTKSTTRLLKMYTEKVKKSGTQKKLADAVVRIEPGRKWFSNTRVVTQEKLEQYRETLDKTVNDPMKVLLKRTKLPVSLFDFKNEVVKQKSSNLLAVSGYNDTFSNKRRQKRSKLEYNDLEQLAALAEATGEAYDNKDQQIDKDLLANKQKELKLSTEIVMTKGTSKRIWGELYKVIDSSDIILEVLDSRNPLGTRCYSLEKSIRKNKIFKIIVLVLNKCDLIPISVTKSWIKILSKEYPTVAFKSSIDHPFGKRALIGLLRQLTANMKNRKHISVGLVGFPNVGKSSVINCLRSKKVCKTAPIPGETKVWQYVDLTNKIYLIDCPGIVVNPTEEELNDIDKVVLGVTRAEKLDNPEYYIDKIIEIVGKKKFFNHYLIPEKFCDYSDTYELLVYLAEKYGKLKKGGESCTNIVAVKIINDFQRGKLPYFFVPPNIDATNELEEDNNNSICNDTISEVETIINDFETNCDISSQINMDVNIGTEHTINEQNICQNNMNNKQDV